MNMIKKKFNTSLIGGHIVECFDATLYGFFAILLAPLFFPNHDANISHLAAFGAFAAGYVARPIGAMISGAIGDSRGRTLPIIYSMVLVGVPTLLIGCLPTYDSIGIIAPLLLVLCRLLQGMFYGAEFPGVTLYLYENTPKQHLGAHTGLLIASGVWGSVLAAMTGAIVSMDCMPQWMWRAPFFMGGFAAFYIGFLRSKMFSKEVETPVARTNFLAPLKEMLASHKLSCMMAIMVSGFTVAPLYIATIFGNKIFHGLGYSSSEAMLLNMTGLLINGLAIVLAGRLADKIGFHRQMVIGCLATAGVVLPCFMFLYNVPGLGSVLVFLLVLISAGSLINGCAMPYLAGAFPASCRYSAMAINWTLGMALIGGNVPLVSGYLSTVTGSNFAPAYCLIVLAILTCGAIVLHNCCVKKTHA